jgi:hypothetical protein
MGRRRRCKAGGAEMKKTTRLLLEAGLGRCRKLVTSVLMRETVGLRRWGTTLLEVEGEREGSLVL